MFANQLRALLFLLAFSSQGSAYSDEPFPSHCTADEHVYLTARLAYESDANGVRPNKKMGRILSICADRKSEPLGTLAIRYGVIGAVELEYKGNATTKVKIYLERTGQGMADQILFFAIGRRTYYIAEGVGLASGVSFYAVEKKRLISYGSSGSELGVDYQHGELEINFSAPSSSVLVREQPRDDR
jgi:hypothetical protein